MNRLKMIRLLSLILSLFLLTQPLFASADEGQPEEIISEISIDYLENGLLELRQDGENSSLRYTISGPYRIWNFDRDKVLKYKSGDAIEAATLSDKLLYFAVYDDAIPQVWDFSFEKRNGQWHFTGGGENSSVFLSYFGLCNDIFDNGEFSVIMLRPDCAVFSGVINGNSKVFLPSINRPEKIYDPEYLVGYFQNLYLENRDYDEKIASLIKKYGSFKNVPVFEIPSGGSTTQLSLDKFEPQLPTITSYNKAPAISKLLGICSISLMLSCGLVVVLIVSKKKNAL